jgi:hypothetical protein
MPRIVVRINPCGSFSPGVTSFAITPATKPIRRLAKLADAFQERAPLDAEALDAISHSPDGLDDPAVIAEEYDRLTDSWLIARLKRDQPAIAAHERLIKAARLWKQYLRDPRPLRDLGLIADFLTARVILPRSLTTSRPSRDTGADSGGKSSIDADRARYAKLVQELAVRESIQKKAYSLYWDKVARSSADRNAQDTPAARSADDRSLAVATIRANRSPSPPALDSGFFRQLDDRLTNNEKTKLQELSGGELLAGKRLDDLLGDVLDVKDVIVEANSICARIRVFESEQATSLPPPTVPTPGAGRPSVRAIGWGDLIVARERLVGYQAQEIAHIENVLPGEDKIRKHERTRTVEQVTETTTVTENTRERDLQTTDRHELQNQVNEVIDEKFSVKAGVNLSGRMA